MGVRGRLGLDICEWVCFDLVEIFLGLWVGLRLIGCVVRVCKVFKDVFVRRVLKVVGF